MTEVVRKERAGPDKKDAWWMPEMVGFFTTENIYHLKVDSIQKTVRQQEIISIPFCFWSSTATILIEFTFEMDGFVTTEKIYNFKVGILN